MTLPVIARSWNISGCNRITGVSSIDTTQRMIYGLKNWLVTHGYTVLWSASNGTGPTNSADHTDRITSASTWTPRNAATAASQAWIVLVDALGQQILLSFTGSDDSQGRVAYSPGGNYVLAGATTFIPTTAVVNDERLLTGSTGTSLHTNNAVDHLWSAWVSSDSKAFMFAVASAGAFVGAIWGVETVAPATFGQSVTWAVPTWGFFFAANQLTVAAGNNSFTAASVGGVSRITVSGISYNVTIDTACEAAGGSTTWSGYIGAIQPELHAAGFVNQPVAISTKSNVGARGKLGTLIDWWLGESSAVSGKTEAVSQPLKFIYLGIFLRPWDGTTPVVMA